MGVGRDPASILPVAIDFTNRVEIVIMHTVKMRIFENASRLGGDGGRPVYFLDSV